MTNPTIEIDLGEILKEIKSDQKSIFQEISEIKKEIKSDQKVILEEISNIRTGQARLEEKVINLEKDHNEFKESTRKNFDDIRESTRKNFDDLRESNRRNFDDLKELIEKNNNETKESIKELKTAQETLAADVADLKGVKSLIIPIVVAVTTAILTLVARSIPFG